MPFGRSTTHCLTSTSKFGCWNFAGLYLYPSASSQRPTSRRCRAYAYRSRSLSGQTFLSKNCSADEPEMSVPVAAWRERKARARACSSVWVWSCAHVVEHPGVAVGKKRERRRSTLNATLM